MPTATTNPRIDCKAFQDIVPEVATGMAAISHALRKSSIEPDLFELIKIRASQINGCAFCVQYHLNDARKLNIPAEARPARRVARSRHLTRRAKWPPSSGPSA